MLRLSALKITSSSPSCSPVVSHPSVLLRSQGGPLSGLPFVACPSSPHQRFASHLFRVLLLRRLHLLLPLSSRSCRCGRPLDARGHHCTSCPTSGVLGRRRSRCTCENQRVRERHGSSSSGSSRPTTPPLFRLTPSCRRGLTTNVQMWTVLLCNGLAGGRSALIPSSVELTGGPNWWFKPLRLAVAGLLRRRPSCGWCAPRPFHCQRSSECELV